MSYSTFRLGANDATKEPMFLGQSVNVARYDQQKYRDFEKLIERQLSFFWRPEEVDISVIVSTSTRSCGTTNVTFF